MKGWRFNGSSTAALFFVIASLSTANAALIDEVIAGEKKEGVIELYAPSTLTPQGAQRLGEAFNSQSGLTLNLNLNPSGPITRNVGTIDGISTSGTPQKWTSCCCMMGATPLCG